MASSSIAVSVVPAAPPSTSPEDEQILSLLPESMPFRWRMAVRELVATERTYIAELRTIMRGYIHVIPDHVRALRL